MSNISNPNLTQLDGSKPSTNSALRLLLTVGLGTLGILLYLLLLTIEAGPLVSFAVMFFIYVPVSRAIYKKYNPTNGNQD